MTKIELNKLPYVSEIKADIIDNTYQIFLNEELYITGQYMQFFISKSEKKNFVYSDKDSLLREVKKIKELLRKNNKSYRFVLSERLLQIFFN